MGNDIVGYDEIVVGEQNRGGAGGDYHRDSMVGMSPEDAYTVLGELAAKSPQLNALLQRRVANNRPMIRKIAPNRWRDWQVDFPSTYGTAASSTTITVNPQVLFEGQRIMATDSFTTAGYGTRIGAILVGQQNQRPTNAGSTLTGFFANNSIGTGIKWDTCQIGNQISMSVSFTQNCTFDCTVFGRAVV